MSVLIKGFPMPNNCGACPLRLAWCRERIYMVTRPERCPLVPVPPHGRLIDADALDIYRREEQAWHDYEQNPDNEYLEGVKDGLHEAAKQLSTAPTIIPAEESTQKDGGHNEAPSGPYDLLYEEGGPDA